MEQKNTPEESVLPANIKPRELVSEMQDCYLDYAMSVIVSRALPDVRDGLKPVHRRILFSMHELGLRSSAKFRKSALVVGDVLGKYHPHGDTAVYDSMVRMAQDFSLRYPLINGQGNFGSIDGDSPAAMRYTEAKMQKISDEMLVDIDKETIAFRDNYDASRKEPVVLPAKLPNLLLNGAMGIAVGMATNIPPHNLGELIDGLFYLIDNPDCTVDDLMEYVKAPDFPTSGLIYDIEAIRTAYNTGRGSVAIRGKADIVEEDNKQKIIITEIPYQVNKAVLVTKIAELVRDKKVVGISDLRDESNRKGIRVVVELKRDSFPKKILNQLYKYTNLQTSFGFNMIALENGIQPKLFDLKGILSEFIKHRNIVITNRVKYDLKIAEARAHILEGLKKALEHIDAVIETIRSAPTKEQAKIDLMAKFNFSDKQTDAILQMRLQTLAGLERKKIDDELKEKLDFIKECQAILANPQRILDIIKEDLSHLKDKYADERRTQIIPHGIGKFSAKDTIPNEPMIITLTKENYIKRITPTTYRSQHRGGKGIIGATTKESDEIKYILHTNNHNDILYFTNQGRVFKLPAYEVPQASRTAKGQAIINLLNLDKNEVVTTMLDYTRKRGKYMFMATRKGTVKKTNLDDFANVRKSGLIAIKLREGDLLNWVKFTDEDNEIAIVTQEGKCIRFNEGDVRSMGRASMGVRGIRLKPADKVVEMDVLHIDPAQARLLVIMENGLGKVTKITEYRYQNRGGSGVKTANLTTKTGKIVGAKILLKGQEADIILMSKQGQMIRMNIKDVPMRGRATQGVIMMRLKKGDKVASLSLIRTLAEEDARETEETKKKEEKPKNQKKPKLPKKNKKEEIPKEQKQKTEAIQSKEASKESESGMIPLNFEEDNPDVFTNPE